MQLPGAALTERLWARAAPLIDVKRKLLGLGKATLEITSPGAWNKAWLLDGIEEKNARFLSPYGADSNTAVGPATARLANLLVLLPPQRFAAHLGLTPPELLAAALDSEWPRPLLPSWAESALLHRDTAFAAAFVRLWMSERPALEKAHCARGINWAALALLLPSETRQELVLKPVLERVRQQAPNWTWDLGFVPAPWPRTLSLTVVRAIASQLANTATQYLSFAPLPHLRELAWLLPQTVAPSIAPDDSAAVIQQIEAIPDLHEIFQTPRQNFIDTLRFQANLEASLTA